MAALPASGDVAVLRNMTSPGSTTPSFAAPQTFATGTDPNTVIVADFNGDGKPDLAVNDNLTGNVSVLMNETLPGSTTYSFAPDQTFATASGTTGGGLGAADFNEDGRPDLLSVPNNTTGSPENSVTLINITPTGSTTANFIAAFTYASAPNSASSSLAIGDLNGDGLPDVVTANSGINNVAAVITTSTASTPTVNVNGSPATGTIADDDAPVTVTPVSGTTPQSTAVNTAFSTNLAVIVDNAAGHPVSNVSVTFAAPG